MKFPAITISVLIFSESLLLSVAKPKSPVNSKPTKQPVVKTAKKPAAPKGKSPTSSGIPYPASFDGRLELVANPQNPGDANTLAGKVKSALGQVLGPSWTVKVLKVGDYDTSSVRRRLQTTTTVDYTASTNVTCTTNCASVSSTTIDNAQVAVTESANSGTLTSNTGVGVSEPPKTWVLIGNVTGEPDESENGSVSFGIGLSMSGNGYTVIAGATGGAYAQVLKYNSTSWNPVGPHITSGDYANAVQYFGAPNAISGDGKRVVVADSNAYSYKGYVRVYEYNGSSWVQLGTDLQGSNNSYFGTSVAMSRDGSKILVGAYQTYARMYQYDGTNWVQMGPDIKDTITNGGLGEKYDNFGSAVAMTPDASIIAIGAPRFKDKGFVRVFRYENSTFTPMGQDLVADTYYIDFGMRVALSEDGSKLAVCSKANYQRIYSYNATTSLWNQMGSDIAVKASSVALSALGTQVAFWYGRDEYDYDDNTAETFVYKFASSTWTMMGSGILSAAPMNYGTELQNMAMSEDGKTIAIGATDNDVNVGQVVMYKWK